MHLVRDVMSHRVLYVTPEATVNVAMDLLRSQNLDAVPVVHGGRLIGLVDALTLFRYHGELPIEEAMNPTPPTVSADATLGAVAARMRQERVRELPVMNDGQLVGMLTERDLIANWGAAVDTLTGLHWQDDMRQWAARQLNSGREIAVIFLDLNGFGAFNKQRGHVFGDRVLKAIANALKHSVNPETDHLCRYGGDEFAVATVRTLKDTEELAKQLRDTVRAIVIDGEALNLRIAVGVAGGQRQAPRPDTHASSMLDDLVNLASRESTRAKRLPDNLSVKESALQRVEAGGTAGCGLPLDQRVTYVDYNLVRPGEAVEASVILSHLGIERQSTCVQVGAGARPAVAGATVACLKAFLDPDVALEVEDLWEHKTQADQTVIACTVVMQARQNTTRLVGAALLQEDVFRTVINAVLDATNRRIVPFLKPPTGAQSTDPGATPAPV